MRKSFTLLSLTAVLFIVDISLSSAQKIDTIWFNNQWRPTSSVKTRYYFRTIKKLESKLFEVIDHYPDGKPQMAGTFSSIYPEVRNGAFLYYDENGILTNKFIIVDNMRTEAFTYNASGEIISHNTTPAFRTDPIWQPKNENDAKTDDDTYPRYAEGNGVVLEILRKNLGRSAEAQEMRLKGKVTIAITINEDGKIIGIGVKKGTHPILDKEALRVARLIPDNFLPAMRNGKPVTKDFIFPITFNWE